MASEDWISGGGPRYVQMQPETSSFFTSVGSGPEAEPARIFDELPKASIVSVSRPDAGDISPMLLSYTIEVQYKQARSLFLIIVIVFFFLINH